MIKSTDIASISDFIRLKYPVINGAFSCGKAVEQQLTAREHAREM